VLGYCDGQRSATEIERAVIDEYPTLFPSRAQIAQFVAQVLASDTTVDVGNDGSGSPGPGRRATLLE
jgi:hypothetical protein